MRTKETYERAWTLLCAWAQGPNGLPCIMPADSIDFACNMAEMFEDEVRARIEREGEEPSIAKAASEGAREAVQ